MIFYTTQGNCSNMNNKNRQISHDKYDVDITNKYAYACDIKDSNEENVREENVYEENYQQDNLLASIRNEQLDINNKPEEKNNLNQVQQNIEHYRPDYLLSNTHRPHEHRHEYPHEHRS